MDNRTKREKAYSLVKRIFYAEKDIKLAVLEAKTAKRKEVCGGGGQSFKPDPTAGETVRHLSDVPVIRIDGWLIHRPEDWLKVISNTYDVTAEFERGIMDRYFRKGETIDAMTSRGCGCSRSSAFNTLDNFIGTGVEIACQFGLVRVVDA